MANQKSIRVEKVGIREFRICGYTRPYAAQLMAAGAEWQGRELYWRYTGDVLPASIQNIIIGQFSLTPETPMAVAPVIEAAPKTVVTVAPAKPAKEQSGSKTAEKLRKLAEGMQKEIDHKNRPYPFESQPPTYKRVNEYLSRKQDARYLLGVQNTFRALADAWDAGTIPDELKSLTTAGEIRSIYGGNGHKLHNALMAFSNPDAGRVSKEDELEEKRLQVALREYDDYFPTSMRWLQDNMIEAADIQRGDVILEPSAGTGHLAQAIRAAYPENKLICIERVWDFISILELQGFDVTHGDFLESKDAVDVIIMNPPFSRMVDIDHVYHAFELLKPGGRLVSIMSTAPFFNSQKKAAAFRQWFSENGGHMEKLREGAFKESERSTGVNTVMIVMRKPKEATVGPVVEYVKAVEVAAKRLEASEPVVGIAAEIEPDRQAIVERFRERMAEGEEPLDAAIGALDEAIAKPKPLTYDDYTRIKSLYLKSDIVMLHIGVMWATWDVDVSQLQTALAEGNRVHDAKRQYKLKAIEGVDSAKRPMATFSASCTDLLESAVCDAARKTLVLVEPDGTVRVREPKTLEQFNEAIKTLGSEIRAMSEALLGPLEDTHPAIETASETSQNAHSSSVLVGGLPQSAENAKNDAVAQKLTALVSELRKPAPESEIPFTTLYLSGYSNVELLFDHYVEAIRADDSAMSIGRAKQLAAAALLYQQMQECSQEGFAQKYPKHAEEREWATQQQPLVTMLMMISGQPKITEYTYDDEEMGHIVDVVAQTPF